MKVVTLKSDKASNYRTKILLEVSAVYEMEVRMAADSEDSADVKADDFILSPEMDKLTDEFIRKQLPATIGDMTLDAESVKGELMNEWPEEI